MTATVAAPAREAIAAAPGRRVLSFLNLTRATALLVGAAIVVPLLVTVWELVTDDDGLTASLFVDTWRRPGTGAMIRNTVLMVLSSTLLATAIASFFAWINERTNARIGWASATLPIVPFLVPPMAGAIGWIILAEPNVGMLNTFLRFAGDRVGLELGSEGPLDVYSWYGLIGVTTLYLVPHIYLVISAALANVDPSLEEASRVSGAGHLRTLLRVTLPAVRPSIASGMLLAFVVGFALYSVPILIGTGANIDILSVRIVRLMVRAFPPRVAEAVVLCLIMLVFIGSASLLQARLASAGRHATIGGRFGGGATIDLGVFRWIARAAMVVFLVASSVLPFVALAVLSMQRVWSATVDWGALDFATYRSIFSGDILFADALPALRNSIVLGLSGATAGMLIAALVTYYVVARRSTPMGRVIDNVVKLPGALSHIVVALALIATLAGPPISLSGTLLLLLIGYLIMYMPQATVTAGSAFLQVDKSLNEASRSSGASEFRTFRRVTLPLMVPGLATGWIFVFVLMVGDLTGSVMLASTNTPVLGTVLLGAFQNGSYTDVAALSIVGTVLPGLIAITVLVASRTFFGVRRSSGRRRLAGVRARLRPVRAVSQSRPSR